jgi:hypothetical protein
MNKINSQAFGHEATEARAGMDVGVEQPSIAPQRVLHVVRRGRHRHPPGPTLRGCRAGAGRRRGPGDEGVGVGVGAWRGVVVQQQEAGGEVREYKIDALGKRSTVQK